MVFFYLKLST